MGSNQYWAGRVYDLCVNFMTDGSTETTESVFMEKPGIEPAACALSMRRRVPKKTSRCRKWR